MSLPVEADFAIIKIGDGAGPEVFTIACGLQNVSVNAVANTADRFVRDCTKPGEVPYRKVRTTGKQMDVTGDGLIDKAQIDIYLDNLGIKRNYQVELYIDDGSDAGVLLGEYTGNFVMTASNQSISREGDSTAEITLASNGAWVWTPAP